MAISFLSILDSAFTAFLSFLITFLIFNFYIEKPFSIIFGVCIAILIFLIAIDKISKSSAKKSLDKEKNKAINSMANSLCLLEPVKVIELFEKAINRRGYKTIKKRGGIFIEELKCAVFIIFSFDEITKTDVVKVFNKISSKEKAYIVGQNASAELLEFIARFDHRIEFVDGGKTYELLNGANCLPKEKLMPKKKTMHLKNFLSRLFVRKNSKKYLGFGIFFLLMSSFVVIKFYYITCACIFITLSLFCRLFGRAEIKG